MFMGEYNYTMDEKGRLNLPPRFREQLEQGMVLTRWMDQCLVLFPQQEWERICQKLQSRSMVKTRDLQRFLFALASEAAVDKQGRILIPQNLREHAGLEKDVTVIGAAVRAEIWDTARWNAYNASQTDEAIEASMSLLDF